jgi:hypothetical protein
MNELLLFERGGRVCAGIVLDMKDDLFFCGRTYSAVEVFGGFAEADFLLDGSGKIVGFSFSIAGDEECFNLPLFNLENAFVNDGTVKILLKEVAYHIEVAQVIGTTLYASDDANYMVGIPGVDIGTVAIDFAEIL